MIKVGLEHNRQGTRMFLIKGLIVKFSLKTALHTG